METESIVGLIEAADKMRSEIVLCLLGQPGIGKTEAVELFAKKHNRNIVHMIASQILPSEVSGITMPDAKTESMKIYDHARLASMKDGDILFLDELLKGQQQVLNACLTLIQERRLMSGRKLPDILIIAAANPLASVNQLPVEIRQRFMFVNVEWSKSSWLKYMADLGFENKESLQTLAMTVENRMSETNKWNTLTPRTATKLCLWVKASKDDEGAKSSVRDYIEDIYGFDIYQKILDTLKPSSEGIMKEGYAKLIEYLDGTGSEDENVEDAKSIIGTLMDEDTETTDEEKGDLLLELIKKLKALDEWDEIEKILTDIKL